MKGDLTMNKIATGMILGGIVGAASIMWMNMDKKDMRKVQRRGKRVLNKAEDLLHDIKDLV